MSTKLFDIAIGSTSGFLIAAVESTGDLDAAVKAEGEMSGLRFRVPFEADDGTFDEAVYVRWNVARAPVSEVEENFLEVLVKHDGLAYFRAPEDYEFVGQVGQGGASPVEDGIHGPQAMIEKAVSGAVENLIDKLGVAALRFAKNLAIDIEIDRDGWVQARLSLYWRNECTRWLERMSDDEVLEELQRTGFARDVAHSFLSEGWIVDRRAIAA